MTILRMCVSTLMVLVLLTGCISVETPLSDEAYKVQALCNAAKMPRADIAKQLIEKGANIDMAIATLEQEVAQFENQSTWDLPDGQRREYAMIAAKSRSGVKLLERLQKEISPQVQLLQIVPPPSTNTPTDPEVGKKQTTINPTDATQRLLDAKKLLDANVITEEEFEAIKAKELPVALQNPEKL